MIGNVLLLLCLTLFTINYCTTANDIMYPYGTSSGDVEINSLSSPNKNFYKELNLTIPIPFVSNLKNQLYLTSYGYITATVPANDFRSYSVPSSSFQGWHHEYTFEKPNATFFYREDTSPSILQNATEDVRRVDGYSNFVAISTVVNTLYKATDNSSSNGVEHTYQQIIVTDGKRTFAIMNYYDVPCCVTNEISYADENYPTKQILVDESVYHHIGNTSNVNVEGRYVFKLFNCTKHSYGECCYNCTTSAYDCDCDAGWGGSECSSCLGCANLQCDKQCVCDKNGKAYCEECPGCATRHLECNTRSLKLSFNKTLIEARKRPYEIKFHGQDGVNGCSGINGTQPNYINGDQIHIDADYEDCGINIIESNENIIYNQTVIVLYGENPSNHLVFREEFDEYNVQCIKHRNFTQHMENVINVTHVRSGKSKSNDTADWDITLKRTNAGWVGEDTTGTVALGETLYFDIRIETGRSDIELNPQNCYAVKADGSSRFNIITNRCLDPSDKTSVISIHERKYFQWRVEAFKYFDSNQIYMKCDVLICTTSSVSPLCSPCPEKRKKREIAFIGGISSIDGSQPTSYEIRSPVFVIVEKTDSTRANANSEKSSSIFDGTNGIVIIVLLGILIFIASIAVIRKIFLNSPRDTHAPPDQSCKTVTGYDNSGMA